MPKSSVPRDRELRQLFGQLCDQAADVAASFQTCRCSEDVRSTETDGLGGVNAPTRDLVATLQRVGAASVGNGLSDEALKSTLARLASQVSALDGPTTTPVDGRAESTSNIETPTSPGEERPESPTSTEYPVEPARGPLTLMRLPKEVRALIWWQALRPEGGFVPLAPWAVRQHRYVIWGRGIRARTRPFHHARTALVDRQQNPFLDDLQTASQASAQTWERVGEHPAPGARWTGGWALLHVNMHIYEEAEAAYWRRVVADDLMLSFGCGRGRTGDYWGVLVARSFFYDFTALYLQKIQRMHLDLRRLDYDDGPNGYGAQAFVVRRAGVVTVNYVRYLGAVLSRISTRLTSLRHLSLTLGGWVPDIRQTPWIEDTDYPNTRLHSSEQWVARMRNITGLTRLRLRVVYAPRDPDTINARLDRDPVVQRVIHFMSMLRGSMLVNGDALGVGHMRAWANKRYLEFKEADRFRIVVQCDDSWDKENQVHRHYVEDDEFDPMDGLNNFGDQFRWDPDADSEI